MAMNSLSMVEARLPPGFRFHPRDDELVLDYLAKKLGCGGGGGGWGTWEELVLGGAVLRHGGGAWAAVADELRTRSPCAFSPEVRTPHPIKP